MNLFLSMYPILYDASHTGIDDEQAKEIQNVISAIQNILLWAVGLIGGIIIIYLGIVLALAKSKEEQQQAKSRFLYVLIGVIVIYGAVIIWKVLSGFVGNVTS